MQSLQSLHSHLTQPSPTILDQIGNTPMVKVNRLDTGLCELFLKLESQNPSGSIKDRIALNMIEAAEREGKLREGGLIVEATAGNTGLGLALVASQKGYKLTIVIPDKMSQEKIFHLRAMGATVVITRSDVTKGHPEYYQDLAARIAQEEGGFYINQFSNPHNPETHERYTAPEIWQQMQHNMDAIVLGVGSGGTLTGIGRFLKQISPHTEIILADPVGSILAPLVNEGLEVAPGSWLVEGIGEDFIPDNCELEYVTKAYSITDAESIATSRDILRHEGIICGSSSGTLISAALRYCREQKTPKRVMTFVCDSGNKYLSKIYNEYWLDDHGLIMTKPHGNLRDMIARPYSTKHAIISHPQDSLQQAYKKMKMYDVSQLPVIVEDKIIGIISEFDILVAVTGHQESFQLQVKQAMTKEVITVDVSADLTQLLPIFDKGMVAVVTEHDTFVGIITPIDALQYLRKRIGHA